MSAVSDVIKLAIGRVLGAVWALLGELARFLADGFAAPVLGRISALLALALVVALAWQTMQLNGLKAWTAKDQAARAAAVAKAQADRRRLAAAGVSISNQVGRQVVQRTAEIRTVTRTLIKEVPVYVTPEADRSVVVPVGFVRLFNAAASGSPLAAVPPGPAGAADAPSGIALSTVAETTVDNFGACRVWREQLIGWQAWYAEQAAAWKARAPPG